jgi:hypothetical protein
MGCHTWFHRKLTKDDIHQAKIKALNDKVLAKHGKLKEFIINSINCCDYKWLLSGWGIDNSIVVCHNNIFYATVEDFHDIFRITTYPRKKLYNYKQLKKWMGKYWYDLNEEQKYQLRQFWLKYPKGLIAFG